MVKIYSIHPILIIDDIVKIAKENPSIVGELQNDAKAAADHRSFTMVFIAVMKI